MDGGREREGWFTVYVRVLPACGDLAILYHCKDFSVYCGYSV